MKLTKTEKFALDFLRKAWRDEPEPMLTVHSPYGLMRASYYTKFYRGVEFWAKVLRKLEKKGFVKKDKNTEIWYITK